MAQDVTNDAPHRQIITTRAELLSALLLLTSRTTRLLRLAAADPSVLSLEDARLAAALRDLLATSRLARIHVLADRMDWLDASAPRLRRLQRDYPHALLIRRADAHDPVGRDTVAIGDDRDALRLQPTAALRGELCCQDGAFVRPLIASFDRRWQYASHDQAAKPLGL